MTKLTVGFDEAQRVAIITTETAKNLPEGFESVGTFTYEDEGSPQGEGGEHIYITEAKKLLEKKGHPLSGIRFEDRASTQAEPDMADLTIKDIEQHNAARLRGTPETGENTEITLAGKPAEDTVDADEVPNKEVASNLPAEGS